VRDDPVPAVPSDALLVPFLPMLAIAGRLPEEGTRWAYELKWDGVRIVARMGQGRVRLTSRAGNDVTVSYPELSELGALLPDGTIVDGELVALDGAGKPSFELLQRRMHVSDATRAKRLAATVPAAYLVFDLCLVAGRWLTEEPYARRREALGELAPGGAHTTVPAATGLGAGASLEMARSCGLEGVVAKRLDSPYRAGERSPSWVKSKLVETVEVVLCGWLPGSGRRAGRLGALLVGVPGRAGLEYAGRVGTGFSDATLADLTRRLAERPWPAHPFAEPPDDVLAEARWVRPELVGEVTFRQWTSAGKLRAPSWCRLRPDLEPGALRGPAARRA
jgi:bifunctional non-homologous end joining protein LigD